MGRANIRSASLGEAHSMFLDDSGAVWACGENRSGQCGVGSPQEQLSQHLARHGQGDWGMGGVASWSSSNSDAGPFASERGSGGASTSASWQGHAHQQQAAAHQWRSLNLKPMPSLRHNERQAELDLAQRLYDPSLRAKVSHTRGGGEAAMSMPIQHLAHGRKRKLVPVMSKQVSSARAESWHA